MMTKYYVPLMKRRKGQAIIVAYVTVYAESREMAYEVVDKTYDDTNLYPGEPNFDEPGL